MVTHETKMKIDTSTILDRLFGGRNFFKALPVIIMPPLLLTASMLVIAVILPVKLTRTDVDTEFIIFSMIVAAGLLIIGLKILFKDSLYFRISFAVVIIGAVIAI
ncbi:MAG: hypothetical protein ACFFD4_26020, partial [Candidatus Odinarchaeota archaeon]